MCLGGGGSGGDDYDDDVKCYLNATQSGVKLYVITVW
jgi:hypothetical protein